MKVEIVDRNGNRVVFVVTLSSVLQNFALNLIPGTGTVPAGFERGFIKEIVFVQDQTLGSPLLRDVVTIRTVGTEYIPTILPTNLTDIQTMLVQRGLDYFDLGIDPLTHFPYDHRSSDGTFAKYTQPTLIGFYLQILGDVINGKLNNGMTVTQALTEVDAIVDSLLRVQSAYGWFGFIPWMNLSPEGASSSSVSLLDNANLAQSLAVMMGALQGAGLTGNNLTAANGIIGNTEQFLEAQRPAYKKFVDGATGLFRLSYDRSQADPSKAFSFYVNHLSAEERGAIAFVQVYYNDPLIPRTVWDNLEIWTGNYTDRNGNVIKNLLGWDGAGFQIFWPSLRNDERAFAGFRDMLYNQLISQMDWAVKNNLPGILSASGLPEGGYSGGIGVPTLSQETLNPYNSSDYHDMVLMDVGSTYALAAAFAIDPYAVLGWLDAIDNVAGLNDLYGFFDAARSATEISREYIGIDVASSILGLGGNGPKDFETYMRSKGLESAYNLLYDSASRKLQALISRTTATFPAAPEIPNRSLAVFSNFSSEGKDGSFPDVYITGTTSIYGAQFIQKTPLADGWGGHYWKLDQAYDARGNQLLIHYTTADTPVAIKIELKNASGQVLYTTTQALANGVRFGRLAIQLPDGALLNGVAQIDVVVDQNVTGDTSFDFTIHSLLFQHFASGCPNAGGTGGTGGGTPAGNGGSQSSHSFPFLTRAQLLLLSPAQREWYIENAAALHVPGANTFFELNFHFTPLNYRNDAHGANWTEGLRGWNFSRGKSGAMKRKNAPPRKSNIDVSKNYYKFVASKKNDRSSPDFGSFGLRQVVDIPASMADPFGVSGEDASNAKQIRGDDEHFN